MFGHASGTFSISIHILCQAFWQLSECFRCSGGGVFTASQCPGLLTAHGPQFRKMQYRRAGGVSFFHIFSGSGETCECGKFWKKLGTRNSLKQVLTGINRLKTWGDELCNVDPLLITPAQHGTNAEGSPSKSFNFATPQVVQKPKGFKWDCSLKPFKLTNIKHYKDKSTTNDDKNDTCVNKNIWGEPSGNRNLFCIVSFHYKKNARRQINPSGLLKKGFTG